MVELLPQYPILNVPLINGSLLIAGVAIVHVVIAHFAVGIGAFNAVHEWRANRKGDAVMLEFLRRNSRFIILFPFIAGTVTGVGIWFSIALVAPRVTSELIHLFVWGWATEWSLFIIEIAAGYVYYFTWDRVSPRVHNALGWIYAIAAFGSLVLINGIISFMLTTGKFTGIDSFWQNLFNPSFWPSTPIRAVSAFALAGIFVIIVVNYSRGFTQEERAHVVRAAGKWLIPLVLMPPLAVWFFRVIPPDARGFIFNQSAMVMVLLFSFGVVASILLGGYAFFGILRGGRYVTGETGLLMLAIAFIATGSMEFVREGIRKPYLVRPSLVAGGPEGIYSTQLTPGELRQTEAEGTLARAHWWPDATSSTDPATRGRVVYLIQCSACHTANGAYNPIKPLVGGWDEQQYAANLTNLHATKDAMPHYSPTERDRKDLEAYLRTLNPPPATTPAPAAVEDAGQPTPTPRAPSPTPRRGNRTRH
ncbi:MAG: cytochrome ubiquinol oxidase subunit I [Phycisphaerae bacterium]|nr:cytochrome ubiquinol oxidase subunit I [Phycisphaerae bacterium]